MNRCSRSGIGDHCHDMNVCASAFNMWNNTVEGFKTRKQPLPRSVSPFCGWLLLVCDGTPLSRVQMLT